MMLNQVGCCEALNVCCPQDDVPLLLWIRPLWNKQGSPLEHCCVFMSAGGLCPPFVRFSVLAQRKVVCCVFLALEPTMSCVLLFL